MSGQRAGQKRLKLIIATVGVVGPSIAMISLVVAPCWAASVAAVFRRS